MDAASTDLPVGRAAARVGVAPSTLRTWGRRYGVVPTGRSAGGHRRYTPADLAVLERMHQLTLEGMPPARAAILALREADDGARAEAADAADEADVGPDLGWEGAGPSAGPGGRVLAVPGAGPRAQGLARAASRLDVEGAVTLLEDALAQLGTLETYDLLLRPVLAAAGEAWARTGTGIEVEHLFSQSAVEALTHHRRTFRDRLRPVPPVLLACAPGDHHVLPLHVLAAALAERLVPCRILGSRVPPEALAAAITRTGTRRVFVWAQVPSPRLRTVLAAVPSRRPPVRTVVGGPGWTDLAPMPGVHVALTAPDALDLLSEA